MSEVWVAAGAAVSAGAAIYSANKQAGAAKAAGNASAQAAQASIDEQRREFDTNQQNQAPWLNTGKSALSVLAGMSGLKDDGSGMSGSSPDYSAFYNSPDYQFALQQGQGALDRDAAARGTLYSGGHTADAISFGQGLASQQFGNFYNRMAGLAGVGQTTANNLGQQGMQMASNIGNLNMQNASNQMNSSYNQANAWSNLAGQVGQIGGQLAGYYMNQPSNPWSTPIVGSNYATPTISAPSTSLTMPNYHPTLAPVSYM